MLKTMYIDRTYARRGDRRCTLLGLEMYDGSSRWRRLSLWARLNGVRSTVRKGSCFNLGEVVCRRALDGSHFFLQYWFVGLFPCQEPD